MTFPKVSPKGLRRGLTALAVVLALAGVGLFSYPFFTDLWAWKIQKGLEADFSAMAKRYEAGQIGEGDPLTYIKIPALDVETIVVEGVTEESLRAGAGHYPMTPLPGEKGNVAIAGHRTTYGKPFNRMDELVPGDKIILITPVGRHVYEVMARPAVAHPNDWSIIEDYPKRGSYLTLTSCHPEGSASYRIWVRAKLVESTNTVAAAGRSA